MSYRFSTGTGCPRRPAGVLRLAPAQAQLIWATAVARGTAVAWGTTVAAGTAPASGRLPARWSSSSLERGWCWVITHAFLVIRRAKGWSGRTGMAPPAGQACGCQLAGVVPSTVSCWPLWRTWMRLGLASSILGTRTCSTPSSIEASTASARTWAGRVIERRNAP